MESKNHLKLSVFTIANESASQCRRVIHDLQRQTARVEIEVIIVAPNRDGIEEEQLRGFGGSQWVILPEISTCGSAMAAAVRRARAPFVTYAEEHSFFHEAWAEELIAAHGQGYDAVGFVMENANPGTMTSWAHLYGQYGPVVAPVESGERIFLAGHHTSYRKQLLLDYGNLLDEMLQDESALFLHLHANRKRMYLAGTAISRHINISNLQALMFAEYTGQRSFAAARAKIGKWSWFKRALYAGGFPLIPLIRLRRILADIRRTGRQAALLPGILIPLFLALVPGACGEMIGYLFGSGDSAQRRVLIELARARYVSAEDRAALTEAGSSLERT